MGGTEVYIARDPDASATLVVHNSSGEELARLDFVEQINNHDRINFPISLRRTDVFDPGELTFELALGELGSITIMVRMLLFHQEDGDWRLQFCDFFVLVPAD